MRIHTCSLGSGKENMTARYERSSNENEQVVWLTEEAPELEEAPVHEKQLTQNPISRLYMRSAEAARA